MVINTNLSQQQPLKGVCVFTTVCVHLDELNAEHKFQVWVTILGHTSLQDQDQGFIGFNKPPIEGNQLPVETNRDHYSFH